MLAMKLAAALLDAQALLHRFSTAACEVNIRISSRWLCEAHIETTMT